MKEPRSRINPWLVIAIASTPLAWGLPVYLSLRYRAAYEPSWRWFWLLIVTLFANELLWRRTRP